LNLTALLFVLLCGMLVVQCLFYLHFFTGVFVKSKNTKNTQEPVSVIICARNNRQGLETNLPQILNQKYPDFEVIVVNDGSTDGTVDFLDNLELDHSNLKVLHLDIDDRYHRGKKFAQTIGIKGAKNNHLLFTDTDCVPSSEYWIEKMVSGFKPGIEIVLGLGNYQRKANPLNWFIQLETFHSAMLFINFALRGKTYMGVGRNLAYNRELFFEVKGFASHQHILSGDDDLFINETSTASNVAVVMDKEGRTISQPSKNFGEWSRQKMRHFSTGRVYKRGDKIRLGTYFASLFLTYLFLTPLLFDEMWLLPALAVYGFRLLIQLVILYKNMKVFDYLPYYFMIPVMDIGILFIQIFVGIRGYFYKPKAW
jgi:poly-beta-1,6-N-acetyl-D-glucosamine synthase